MNAHWKPAAAAALVALFWSVAAPVLAADRDADVILVNADVYTADEERPWADAVAIAGDRILAVGNRRDVMANRGPDTQVIDLGGAFVSPGFNDAHVHMDSTGSLLTGVNLLDVHEPEAFVERVAAATKRLPEGSWIVRGDWGAYEQWGQGSAGEKNRGLETAPTDGGAQGPFTPHRDLIDPVTPDHPVLLSRFDRSMYLANSLALELAGITPETPDPMGGEIDKDADGRLTGILKDNAMTLVDRAVPPPTQQAQLAAIEAAVEYVTARGVTAVHHMGTWDDLAALRLAERRGLLGVRVYACTPLHEWQRLAEEVAEQGRGTDRLQIGGLKGFVDGSLGSHTAAFLEPYSDAPAGRGVLVNQPEDLRQWTVDADAAGLQVMVHAIGDRAIRIQLDAFEQAAQQNGPRDRRFRIEHAQHIHPDDLPRYAELGVIASMQPYHAIDDGRWAEGVIGAVRCETTYAFRSLLDSGAKLALGSDWFVAPPTPLEGIYAAVTRRTLDGANPDGWVPAQKITVEEALRAYTLDAAYAGFQEDKLGSLEPGKLADLVVLDRDLFKIPPDEINQAQVAVTIVGGQVMYEAHQSNEVEQ